MKIPKSINVKGARYKIILVDELYDNDGAPLDGECCKTNRIVKLCSKQKEGDLKSTLIHELIHAVLAECGVSDVISHEVEEIIAINLEKHFIDKWRLELK